jgi:altronate hydrolase
MSAAPRALQLDPADNVAVAVAELRAGDVVQLDDVAVAAAERIPPGHKLALRAIPAGGAVVKYHEPIGRATCAIAPGAHVHVHNVVSARLPGPGSEG